MSVAIATRDEELKARDEELKQGVTFWGDEANKVKIIDQPSYNVAASLVVELTTLERQIVDHHKPIKDATHSAHKAAVAAEKSLLDPVTRAKTVVKSKISTWEREQQRLIQEREREARERAQQISEQLALESAIELEKLGASEEQVAEVLNNPAPLPAPVVQPTFQRASGVSTTTRWSAKVVDLKALCLAVAEGRASTELVLPNMPALNGMARAMKNTMNVPGVKAESETGVNVRVS